jgi:hypothetical protein
MTSEEGTTDQRDPEDGFRILNEEQIREVVQVLVDERLGGGSSGRVYKAVLEGRPAALKILHPHAARREHEVQLFIKEAVLMSKLEHRCGPSRRRKAYKIKLPRAHM